MGSTSDGATINRTLVMLHDSKRKVINQTTNPFDSTDRSFFFFSDPLHLIKTTRNCWASQSRNISVSLSFSYVMITMCNTEKGKENILGTPKKIYSKSRSEHYCIVLYMSISV